MPELSTRHLKEITKSVCTVDVNAIQSQLLIASTTNEPDRE